MSFTLSTDPNVDIASLKIPVTAVASALKFYVKNLPTSVIPAALFDEINDAESEYTLPPFNCILIIIQ